MRGKTNLAMRMDDVAIFCQAAQDAIRTEPSQNRWLQEYLDVIGRYPGGAEKLKLSREDMKLFIEDDALDTIRADDVAKDKTITKLQEQLKDKDRELAEMTRQRDTLQSTIEGNDDRLNDICSKQFSGYNFASYPLDRKFDTIEKAMSNWQRRCKALYDRAVSTEEDLDYAVKALGIVVHTCLKLIKSVLDARKSKSIVEGSKKGVQK